MPQPKKKSGCGKIILILLIILLVLGGGLAVAIYFGYQKLEQTLKSSEAYTTAMTALKENEEVKEKLGDIKDSGFPLGTYNVNANGSGNATFRMSIQGTKGKGHYDVDLVRSSGVWSLTRGTVRTERGETIVISSEKVSIVVDDASDDANTNSDTNTSESASSAKAVAVGVLRAKVISLPRPAYTPIAKQARASGTVVVQVTVNEEGDVISAKAESGHPLLRASAVGAARRAKFSPTTEGGQPVRVSGVITYTFTPE